MMDYFYGWWDHYYIKKGLGPGERSELVKEEVLK